MYSEAVLDKIFKTFDLPPYIENYSLFKLLALQLPPDAFFADKVNQKYPCNDKITTILSACQYFLERDQYPEKSRNKIEANFRQVASKFGVFEDYLKLEEQSKREIFYAAKVRLSDGEIFDTFPIRNKREAVLSIDYLWNNWRLIKPDIRKEAACNILDCCTMREYEIDKEARSRAQLLARLGCIDNDGIEYLYVLMMDVIKNFGENEKVKKHEDFIKSIPSIKQFTLEDINKLLEALQDICDYIPRERMIEPPEKYIYCTIESII
ncbi:MAG: hypothetical protein QXQ37_07150 [Nitrososphaerota archaeon]